VSDRLEARPRRLVPRYVLTLEAKVQPAGLPSLTCQMRNVGVGGMFLATDTPPEQLSHLTVNVTHPELGNAMLTTRVVHAVTLHSARRRGLRAGVGVQLEGLRQAEQQFVSELVEWARTHDPRSRIPRRKEAADRSAAQREPMLGFLLEYIDGQRDPEALADELALDVDTVERMLAELGKSGLIELISASAALGQRPATVAPATQRAAAAPSKPSDPLSPVQLAELAQLEARLDSADHYQLLGVGPGSSAADARSAFLARDAELHPSVRPPAEAQRVERVLGRMRQAASVLSSSEKKSEYDAYMERAKWLADAEALRARASIMPPPPEPGDASAELPQNLAAPRIPSESGAQQPRTRRPPSAAMQAAAPPRPATRLPGQTIPPPRPAALSSGQTMPPPQSAAASPDHTTPRPRRAAASPDHTTPRPHSAAAAPGQTLAPPQTAAASPGHTTPRPHTAAAAAVPEQTLPPPQSAAAVPEQTLPPPRSVTALSGPTQPADRSAAPTLPPPRSSQRAAKADVSQPVSRPAASVSPQSTSSRVAQSQSAPKVAASRPVTKRPTLSPEGERAVRALSARPGRKSCDPQPGAAAQILAQAEDAYANGQADEAHRHLKLLSAMTFEDPAVRARHTELKQKVTRAAAVDFEKQAAYEEKQQR
jgi:hypothetical protein